MTRSRLDFSPEDLGGARPTRPPSAGSGSVPSAERSPDPIRAGGRIARTWSRYFLLGAAIWVATYAALLAFGADPGAERIVTAGGYFAFISLIFLHELDERRRSRKRRRAAHTAGAMAHGERRGRAKR